MIHEISGPLRDSSKWLVLVRLPPLACVAVRSRIG
jgi:hypothetical protein